MGTHTGPVCDPVRMVSTNIPLLILVLWTSQAHQKPLIDDLVKGLGGRIDDILCQYTCRKFSVKACQDTKEKRCTWCTTRSVTPAVSSTATTNTGTSVTLCTQRSARLC